MRSQGIRQAGRDDLAMIRKIVHSTVQQIYPLYYPRGAIDFFLAHHSDSHIATDIASGRVFLLEQEGMPVGTVTIKANEICRLFVLPDYQGKHLGKRLLDFAEQRIAEDYRAIRLDSSLPAKALYLHRGYRILSSHTIDTGDGAYLCYDLMEKSV